MDEVGKRDRHRERGGGERQRYTGVLKYLFIWAESKQGRDREQGTEGLKQALH